MPAETDDILVEWSALPETVEAPAGYAPTVTTVAGYLADLTLTAGILEEVTFTAGRGGAEADD